MLFSGWMENCGGGPTLANTTAISFSVTPAQQDGKVRMRMQVSFDAGPGRINRFREAEIPYTPVVYYGAVKTSVLRFVIHNRDYLAREPSLTI
jgi:hypothetical protein